MIFILRIDANEEIAFDESLTMLDPLPVFMVQRGGETPQGTLPFNGSTSV